MNVALLLATLAMLNAPLVNAAISAPVGPIKSGVPRRKTYQVLKAPQNTGGGHYRADRPDVWRMWMRGRCASMKRVQRELAAT